MSKIKLCYCFLTALSASVLLSACATNISNLSSSYKFTNNPDDQGILAFSSQCNLIDGTAQLSIIRENLLNWKVAPAAAPMTLQVNCSSIKNPRTDLTYVSLPTGYYQMDTLLVSGEIVDGIGTDDVNITSHITPLIFTIHSHKVNYLGHLELTSPPNSAIGSNMKFMITDAFKADLSKFKQKLPLIPSSQYVSAKPFFTK